MTPTNTNTPMSARTLARKQGIDLAKLLDILGLCRGGDSETEAQFVIDHLDTVPGMQQDEYGNRYLTIGDKPRVLWSCHTDTVHSHKREGKQNLKWDGDILGLNQGKPGQCLGADDGAGLWLLLEMIKAGRPGLYVFHRDEETGRNGSKWIAKSNPEFLDRIDIAIAFDRKATGSIITHQSSRRCCSPEFSSALADAFNCTEGLSYKDDDGGSYTDTYSYVDIVPECTNVSVGYYKEHGPLETLDVAHLLRLREALLALDTDVLPVKRDPSKTEYLSYGGYGMGRQNWGAHYWKTPLERLADIIKERPNALAKWLENMGMESYGLNKVLDKIVADSQPAPLTVVKKEEKEWQGALASLPAPDDDKDLAGEADKYDEEEPLVVLVCEDCSYVSDSFFNPADGDECERCFGYNTYAGEADPVSGELVE